MMDHSSVLENSNELKFSREQGFFDKSLGIKAFIGCVFVTAFFLFLHFRENHLEVLELNSEAPSYIVAQTDFDFLDEEATLLAKQAAVQDLGKIYRVSEKSITDHQVSFENFLIYNQDWRKYVDSNHFDELHNGINVVSKKIKKLHFTDARTFQKMTEVDYSTNDYLIYTPHDISEPIHFPIQIWEYLKQNTQTIETNALDFIISYLQNTNWNVVEDSQAENNLKRKIQSQIEPVFSHVTAGSRIIDQGEKVTARHLAIMQAMKKALGDQRNLWHPLTILGSLLMTLILTIICVAYFRVNQPEIMKSNRKLFLLVSIVIFTFIFAKATEFFLVNSQTNLIDYVRYPIFVPFAAILLSSLINTSLAMFVSAFLTVILTMVLAFNQYGFMIINLATAMVAILSTRSLQKRKEIFIVCGLAWLCAVGLILAIHFYQAVDWNRYILSDIVSSGLFLLFTSIIVVGLLPLLESLFGIMTNVTLTEYLDPNNDLLRRLSIEAPGTYQHSIVVGNLAEAAASSIGANGLFCRVATLYHDVGKIATPQYFTENQQPGMNIHQLLTPLESAQVIMAHVSEGVALARKAGLPEQFIDIIKEHHGTTLVYYFYRKQLEKVDEDKTKIDERDFRYMGPKPRSKESAIIMIADSLEAAARSLEKVDEKSLMELASRLVRDKADDGQFDESLLTFEELAKVKQALVKTLIAFGHSRIKYPKREKSTEPLPNIEE
ncbi:phosphodiesterase [Candidatus Rubidus massiliensis]|nr:phosphodiesterase [Candidatus Rubidus massiliensis]